MTEDISGDTQLVFFETPSNEPPALAAWFYPGSLVGEEFVYPNSQTRIFSGNSGRSVPSADDHSMKEFQTRGTATDAPDWKDTSRVYRTDKAGKEVSSQSADSERAKMTRDDKWKQYQSANRRRANFDVIVVTPIGAVPATLAQRANVINSTMAGIDEHGKAFQNQFEEALKSSTVKVKDRNDLKAMVSRLEDGLGELKEDYNKKDWKEAHEELRDTLEVAASVNRFMLRSDFHKTEPSWSAVRDDLNRLAGAHSFPVIAVYAVRSK